MVDARLPTGERVNVIIPPLALDGPTLTIRRFPQPYRLDGAGGAGHASTSDAATLLGACVRARFNVMISGGTGSGKTTFLNALSGLIPDARAHRDHRGRRRAVAAAGARRAPRVPARRTSRARARSRIRDLVRNALRMRPDRIVVGEVRGGETLDMLQAMNTGHEGSLATVHANSAVRRARPARDPRQHERARAAGRDDPRPGQLRDRPGDPPRARGRRHAPRGRDRRARCPAAGRTTTWCRCGPSGRTRSGRTGTSRGTLDQPPAAAGRSGTGSCARGSRSSVAEGGAA